MVPGALARSVAASDHPGMQVLVTGATGFIGFHAARALRERGHGVRVLARSRKKAASVLGPIGVAGSDCVEGDMCDGTAVANAMEGCDSVLHAAAGVSVTSGQTDFSANLIGTRNVIGRALDRGLESIFLSSITAIFDPRRPTTGASPLVEAKTHYGRSKAECDAWVRARQQEGAPVGIVYPAGVVGPDDPGMSESVRAFRSFLRGTLKSEGGNQTVDVRDLAVVLVKLLENRTRGRIIAAGHYQDWDEFTDLLASVTGAEIPRIRAPGWALRGVARTMDAVGRATGRRMPLTGEGIEIATRMRPMQDSAELEAFGHEWRSTEETLRDLFQWFLDTGRLPPKAVPALRERQEEPRPQRERYGDKEDTQ